MLLKREGIKKVKEEGGGVRGRAVKMNVSVAKNKDVVIKRKDVRKKI